jgi:hypothetical protein
MYEYYQVEEYSVINGGVSQEVRNIVHPESLSKQVLHSRMQCTVLTSKRSSSSHLISSTLELSQH